MQCVSPSVVVVFTSNIDPADTAAPSPAPWSCWCRGCPARRGTAGAHRNRAAPAPPPPAPSSPAALHPPRLLTSGHSALKRCLVIDNLTTAPQLHWPIFLFCWALFCLCFSSMSLRCWSSLCCRMLAEGRLSILQIYIALQGVSYIIHQAEAGHGHTITIQENFNKKSQ